MRKVWVLFMKCCFIFYLLLISPFFNSVNTMLYHATTYLTTSSFEDRLFDEDFSLKEQLQLLSVNENVILSDAGNVYMTQANYVEANKQPEQVPQEALDEVKRVYIYNTHQQEKYLDDKGVVEASIHLANVLQEHGIQVVYESNDFTQYLKAHGLDYNSSYVASNFYLNEALVNYSGFDLVIDFHRDSVPRENTFLEVNGVSYAKIMFVVGASSPNAAHIEGVSNTFKDSLNAQVDGVCKDTRVQGMYYNQEVYQNMILVEMGSENNTYEEVIHSTNLFAQSIIQYLG